MVAPGRILVAPTEAAAWTDLQSGHTEYKDLQSDKTNRRMDEYPIANANTQCGRIKSDRADRAEIRLSGKRPRPWDISERPSHEKKRPSHEKKRPSHEKKRPSREKKRAAFFTKQLVLVSRQFSLITHHSSLITSSPVQPKNLSRAYPVRARAAMILRHFV